LIYTKAKNIFEALSPRLEAHEEEIIYPHPSLPGVFCNQLGVLTYDEKIYTMMEGLNGIYLRMRDGEKNSRGTKLKIIWECYKGEDYKGEGSPHVYYKNGNIYDHTKENLIVSTEIPKSSRILLNEVKKKFILNSVLRLIEIEKKWEKHEVSPQDLWEMMFLPRWLIGARQRFDGKEVRGKKILK